MSESLHIESPREMDDDSSHYFQASQPRRSASVTSYTPNCLVNAPSSPSRWRKFRAYSSIYLRQVWCDILFLPIFGALAAGIYFTPVYFFNHRLLPFSSSVCGDLSCLDCEAVRFPMRFGYPYQKTPIPSWACGLASFFIPFSIIAIFQSKIRSVWDSHAGVIGLSKACTTTALIVIILKHFVGGFRPHFIDACNPNTTILFQLLDQKMFFFNVTVCTGDKDILKEAVQSFPSGHTASSFAPATFLALYLNAKLKTIGDHASQYWTLIATITPLIIASLVAATLYLSHQHDAQEIFFSIILGFMIGTLAYRSSYAAVFDSRYNHIPLPPFAARTQFTYSGGGGPGSDRICNGEDKGKEEVDKLLVWSWWKSRPNESGRERETVWLRSIRRTRVKGLKLGLKFEQSLPQNDQDVITRERIMERIRLAANLSHYS